MDPYDQQENDELNEDPIEYLKSSDTGTLESTEVQSADLGNTDSLTNQVRVVPDNVINENIRSFNMQQREVSNFVHKCPRDYIKSLGCKIRLNIKPFYIFIACRADVRKPHLIKTIHMSLSKFLMYKGGHPEKPRIL